MTPGVARVRARREDGGGAITLDLQPKWGPGAHPVPSAPGQFNMLTVFGVGESAISLSGDPANTQHLVHTIRPVGPVSGALARLEPGAVVGVRGPFGKGWPMADARGRDVVLVAGGVGLAPLRPVLYRLLAGRPQYGRILLLYGARSPADILFRNELVSWARRSDLRVETTVDHATETWRGHVGVVPRLIPLAEFDPASAIAFVCGPEIMMRFAIAALRDAGVPETDIYLSMERNMKCAVGLCGHCQFGRDFVCRDGPVFPHARVRDLLALKEI